MNVTKELWERTMKEVQKEKQKKQREEFKKLALEIYRRRDAAQRANNRAQTGKGTPAQSPYSAGQKADGSIGTQASFKNAGKWQDTGSPSTQSMQKAGQIGKKIQPINTVRKAGKAQNHIVTPNIDPPITLKDIFSRMPIYDSTNKGNEKNRQTGGVHQAFGAAFGNERKGSSNTDAPGEKNNLPNSIEMVYNVDRENEGVDPIRYKQTRKKSLGETLPGMSANNGTAEGQIKRLGAISQNKSNGEGASRISRDTALEPQEQNAAAQAMRKFLEEHPDVTLPNGMNAKCCKRSASDIWGRITMKMRAESN